VLRSGTRTGFKRIKLRGSEHRKVRAKKTSREQL
jgi:hypothetical protein